MVSPAQWTWIRANSGRWWRTGNPGVLQFMGSQRIRHNSVTQQQQIAITKFKMKQVEPVWQNVDGSWICEIRIWVFHLPFSLLFLCLKTFKLPRSLSVKWGVTVVSGVGTWTSQAALRPACDSAIMHLRATVVVKEVNLTAGEILPNKGFFIGLAWIYRLEKVLS